MSVTLHRVAYAIDIQFYMGEQRICTTRWQRYIWDAMVHMFCGSYNAISCASSAKILKASLWGRDVTCPHPNLQHHIYGMTFPARPSWYPSWIHFQILLHNRTAAEIGPCGAKMDTIALCPYDALELAQNKYIVEFVCTQSVDHTYIAPFALSLTKNFTYTHVMYNVTVTSAAYIIHE